MADKFVACLKPGVIMMCASFTWCVYAVVKTQNCWWCKFVGQHQNDLENDNLLRSVTKLSGNSALPLKTSTSNEFLFGFVLCCCCKFVGQHKNSLENDTTLRSEAKLCGNSVLPLKKSSSNEFLFGFVLCCWQ